MICTECPNELKGRQKKFCSRICQNKSGNTRNQVYVLQQERGKKRKLAAIAKMGGECQACGYKKNWAALVFHHTRDKTMSLDLRALSNNSQKKIDEELIKCQLLCHNCHGEHHNPQCALTH